MSEMAARRRTRSTALSALSCLCALVFCSTANAGGASLLGWGDDFNGQLGDGSTGVEAVTIPVPAKGISSATEVATGFEHSLVLLDDGSVSGIGGNVYGELGDGTSEDSLTPIAIPGTSGAIAVAAGAEHSLALLANGTVLAWGSNGDGQLGLSDGAVGPETCNTIRPCRRTVAPVPGLTDVVAIAAAQRWNLALRADGTVMAWGEDGVGQLGDGTGVTEGCECVDHPIPVAGVSGAVAISAGTLAGYALLADGSVRSWGENGQGALGNGVAGGSGECGCLPPLTVFGLAPVEQASGGGSFALALRPDGAVDAWGLNNSGELGNGSASKEGCFCVPLASAVAGLGPAHAVLATTNNGFAVLADGRVMAWGLGKGGGIGNGSVKDSYVPTPVTGVAGASGVGGFHGTHFALIGSSQALDVSLAGAGAGTVGTRGLLCSGGPCRETYPQGQVEVLRAETSAGFAGWTGACSGTGACQVKLDGDRSVTATFGPPKGTRITKAKIDRKKRRAKFRFTAPGAISGYQCRLVAPKRKKAAAKSAKKKRKPKFSRCAPGKTYKKLKAGRYRFEVRALDILGADAKPAKRKFKLRFPSVSP